MTETRKALSQSVKSKKYENKIFIIQCVSGKKDGDRFLQVEDRKHLDRTAVEDISLHLIFPKILLQLCFIF